MQSDTIAKIKNYMLSLQNDICDTCEQIDTEKKFKQDLWEHHTGGGGRSRIFQNGKVFEKAGVNFSHIYGKNLPDSSMANRQNINSVGFQALGISLVIHPYNPFVPTSHANLRFITVEQTDGSHRWWFGGGYDLTPYYGFETDCKHWHQTAKQACDPFGLEIYPEFKKWCDDYFFLKHRNEPRGIGGLFFDDFNRWELDKCFDLIKSIGNSYLPAYIPIVKRRKDTKFNKQQRDFQEYRRGRYVEFNLVYDRGTLFGLQTGGRTESILMSLPPEVKWLYDWKPEEGSKEQKLYDKFLIAQPWA